LADYLRRLAAYDISHYAFHFIITADIAITCHIRINSHWDYLLLLLLSTLAISHTAIELLFYAITDII